MELKVKEVRAFGEHLVTDVLVGSGHEILARNYQSKFGDLDIVTYEDRTLHFVEVKTMLVADISRETGFVVEDCVAKLQKVAQAAYMFMEEFSYFSDNVQIDVAGVYVSRDFYKRHQRDTILGPIKDIDYWVVYLEDVCG